MDAGTIAWIGPRVDRARELIKTITDLKSTKGYFTTTESPLSLLCGGRSVFFHRSDGRWHEVLQEAIAGILDAQIAEAQAELDAI